MLCKNLRISGSMQFVTVTVSTLSTIDCTVCKQSTQLGYSTTLLINESDKQQMRI